MAVSNSRYISWGIQVMGVRTKCVDPKMTRTNVLHTRTKSILFEINWKICLT